MVEGTDFKFGTDTLRESPDMTPENFFEKRAWPRSRDPLNFWALNANSFKTVEGMDFKFGTDTPRESPDMTPGKFFRKGGVARVT